MKKHNLTSGHSLFFFRNGGLQRGLVPRITHDQQTFDSDQEHHLNRKKSSKTPSVRKISMQRSRFFVSFPKQRRHRDKKNPDSIFNQPPTTIKPNHRKEKIKFHSQKHRQTKNSFSKRRETVDLNSLQKIQICSREKQSPGIQTTSCKIKSKEGPNFFSIWEKSCSCNNWRLPGEPRSLDNLFLK